MSKFSQRSELRCQMSERRFEVVRARSEVKCQKPKARGQMSKVKLGQNYKVIRT